MIIEEFGPIPIAVPILTLHKVLLKCYTESYRVILYNFIHSNEATLKMNDNDELCFLSAMVESTNTIFKK